MKIVELIRSLIEKYRDDPIGFCRDLLKVELDPPQANILRDIAAGERRITVRSGHGVGKSTTLAFAVIWFMFTRWPAKVIVTAPTAGQLWDALWAEIRSRFAQLPPGLVDIFEMMAEKIVLRADPDNSFCSARTSSKERPEALAGVHSENVLLIADEASGIPEEVFVSGSGSMSGHNACTVLTGNPTRLTGFFADTHRKPGVREMWKQHHISCLDSPRVSRDFIDQIRRTYGEDSNEYRVRVLGEFPTSDDEALIPYDLVVAAMSRDVSPGGRPIWAIDPARFGRDRTAFVERIGQVVSPVQCWQGLDLMQTAGKIVTMWNTVPLKHRPAEILVDSIGIGAGVVDRLRELDLPVRGINVSESAPVGSTTSRLRDELWVKCRDWLAARTGKLPNDMELLADLTAPKFSYLSNGKLKVESKDDMKSRGVRSPDIADALCLTFASDAATLTHGYGAKEPSKPLRRNLRHV